jgi:xanthine dehydrogenase accessory factor
VFLEAIEAPPRLFIVGATHAAVALSRFAAALGFRVTVIDPRSPFATPERFPDAELRRDWPDAVLGEADLDASCCVATLTHDPKFDLPALGCALRSPARYVGALGSRATQERRRAALREQGFGEDALARVRGPIGLDLGARSPEEIALAILAEIVAVRRGRAGGALAAQSGPIHGR